MQKNTRLTEAKPGANEHAQFNVKHLRETTAGEFLLKLVSWLTLAFLCWLEATR